MDRLTAMETFVRVVDTGSFSAAARQLRVGQPAISKMIAQLEDRLGVRLLLRSTRSLTPTEAGQNFYDRARRLIAEADEVERIARGDAIGLSGRVRISSSVCFARINIMPRLPEFLEKHPEIEIDLVLDDRNRDLVEDGIDVALRMGSQVDSTLTGRKIGECRRVVVATPSYLQRHGVPQTPADLLAHQTIIHTLNPHNTVRVFRQGTSEISVTAQGRLRVTAAEGVREAVFAHLGLAIVSEWLFTPELRAGIVTTVLDDWELPPVELWAVSPTGRLVSSKVREFVAFVEDCVAQPS